MKTFDLKNFNGEVFLAYSRTITDPYKTRLINAGVFYTDEEIALKFPAQVGGNYATRPIKGLLQGEAVALDGNTNIDDGSLPTYSQGIVAIERGKSFTEKDFSYSLTGKDWILDVAEQVAHYWNKQDQKVMLAILKGIFASALSTSIITKSSIASSDIIDAVRGIGGDNADIFTVVFMHSVVAKHLEREKMLEYVKQNDANGMSLPTNIAYWGSRLVVIDDACPVALSYAKTTDTALVADKEYFTLSGTTYTKVENPDVGDIDDYYEQSHEYLTYILGNNAFCWVNLPVLVPVEMERDAKTNGGQTSLVSREKFVCAPEGISFKATAVETASNKITNAVLETGSNWEVVKSSEATPVALDKKEIPFCAIKYVLNDYNEAHPQA